MATLAIIPRLTRKIGKNQVLSLKKKGLNHDVANLSTEKKKLSREKSKPYPAILIVNKV